ncbi:MAG: dTDP-4-dehydrorhamnose 3,5-epimerase [Gemmatimonadales bacterium]|nr:dTDP-4-dehydrorhamnose 3,5-epimerase [Gemmatimonadales bacterium]
MNVIQTAIPDVLMIDPVVKADERGFFVEVWQEERYRSAGIELRFVQDNHSRSGRGTLRGLHYQIQHAQGKLVRVAAGEVFDVAVDLRRSSPTFGRWVSAVLSGENHRQLWVPPGLAHGFYVMSESADLLYKCTDPYAPQWDRTLKWDDPDVGVEWPLAGGAPLLSPKDQAGVPLRDAEVYP